MTKTLFFWHKQLWVVWLANVVLSTVGYMLVMHTVHNILIKCIGFCTRRITLLREASSSEQVSMYLVMSSSPYVMAWCSAASYKMDLRQTQYRYHQAYWAGAQASR